MHKTVKLWYYAADNTNPWELGTMIDLACPEVRFALDVVRRASALCQRVQTGMAMMGLTKSDFSPVTVADYAVQAMAGQMLAEQFPDALLVGEEKADALREASGAQMRGVVAQFVGRVVPGASEDQVCAWIDRGAAEPGGRYWTLDPVDGTKGYLRGGQYAVALALIDQGTVALGVLGCPNLGEQCQPDVCGLGSLLVARPGEGAWHTSLADDQADFHPLRVSACKDGAAARMLRSFESGHTNAGDIDAIGAKLGVQAEPVLMDSQAKFAVLASGGGELMFRFPPPDKPVYQEKIWDNAAGAVILEEAGGRITDMWGKPLDFTTGRKLTNNSGIFASNGWMHEAGLNAIAEVCGPRPER